MRILWVLSTIPLTLATIPGSAQTFPDESLASAEAALEQEGPLPFDAIPAGAAQPFGAMAISPTRLEFDRANRSLAVSLFNSSDSRVSYRIDMVDLGLDDRGDYRMLKEGELAEWSSAPFVRFSPKQVSLEPGQRQRVRVIVRAPSDLVDREFRSHMQFSTIPTVDPVDSPVGDQREDGADASRNREVSVNVGMRYEVSIPVIFRSGELRSNVEVESAQIRTSEAGHQHVHVTLRRTSPHSQYLIIRLEDGRGENVGELRSIAVMAPSNQRVIRIPLRPMAVPLRVNVFQELEGKKTGQLLTSHELL